MPTVGTLSRDGFSSADERRKRLGQYFTGVRPARLLAALARTHESSSVIDPMVGSGDMLVGTLAHGRPPLIGGMELDAGPLAACVRRLEEVGIPPDAVILGSAFSSTTIGQLPTRAWEAVITNPPYVRYQSSSRAAGVDSTIPSAADVRQDLIASIGLLDALDIEDKRLFAELARRYSGLSDLAVPAWILCAGLVRLHGTLAMLVPTTWLSRDYAKPIRYLIHRWFDVQCIVEDGDASWFSDALVRTTLLVATRVPRRNSAFEAAATDGHVYVRLDAAMGSIDSLVGTLFGNEVDPDIALARSIRTWKAAAEVPRDQMPNARWISAAPERAALRRAMGAHTWLTRVEDELVLNGLSRSAPTPRGELATTVTSRADYLSLDELGWRAGQGLRTGANRFFYVEVIESSDGPCERVLVDPSLGRYALDVPKALLLPVLRRQAELPAGFVVSSRDLKGRVLTLSGSVLPEEIQGLSRHPYGALGDELARHVRAAGRVNVGTAAEPRYVPQLSAVASNARPFDPKRPDRPARFWYQLPPFTDRHLPYLLVARVNSAHPRVLLDAERASVVDANFSTLWATREASVSPYALLAVLNSSWCMAEMELRGTVLGGGALKLEATHLRQLAVPKLSREQWLKAHHLGCRLTAVARTEQADGLIPELDHLILTAMRVESPDEAARRTREIASACLRRRSA